MALQVRELTADELTTITRLAQPLSWLKMHPSALRSALVHVM